MYTQACVMQELLGEHINENIWDEIYNTAVQQYDSDMAERLARINKMKSTPAQVEEHVQK